MVVETRESASPPEPAVAPAPTAERAGPTAAAPALYSELAEIFEAYLAPGRVAAFLLRLRPPVTAPRMIARLLEYRAVLNESLFELPGVNASESPERAAA